MIHANGNWWLSVSQAAILFEVAESLEQYNHRQWVAFRVSNRARVKAERQQQVEAIRGKNESRRGTKLEAAYRLGPQQLDGTTGAIAWPQVLQVEKYKELRSRLEALFQPQAGYVDTFGGDTAEVAQCVESLRRALRRDIGTLDRTDYLTAQKFLCGLKYDAEFGSASAASGDPRTAVSQL